MQAFMFRFLGVQVRFQRLWHNLIASLARWSLAATFWQSGQSKVEGFALNVVQGEFVWGWPHLAQSAVPLFRDEYQLPWIPPLWAAVMAAVAEHTLPVLLLLGLFTPWAALALLGMTMVIQVLVYPGAYMVHGLWAVALLYLMVHGPGDLSVDAWRGLAKTPPTARP